MTAQPNIQMISVDQLRLHPKNIRLYYPPADIEEMATSLAKSGNIQALIVTPTPEHDSHYYVIDGNMRLAAARTIDKCPPLKCEIVAQSEAEQLLTMIVTSHFHYPKDPISKARHYQRLEEQEGLTKDEIANAVGVHRSTINNTVMLLELDNDIQQLIIERRLTGDIKVARLLLRVPDPINRIKLAHRYAQRKMSTTAIVNSLSQVLKNYQRLASQPDPLPPKKAKTKAINPAYDKDQITAQKINDLAELHLCQECRLTGLEDQCYICPGPIEFMNHLIEIVEVRTPEQPVETQHLASQDAQHLASQDAQHLASQDAQHLASQDAQHLASPNGVI